METIEKFEINGWSYFLDKATGNLEVKPSEVIKKPENIYKYYPPTKYSFNAIMRNYLFCSTPYHLNDALDCSEILYNFSNISKQYYESFFNQFDCKKGNLPSYEEDKKNDFESIISNYMIDSIRKTGIICLTESELNPLMWSHYSSEMGFMIELDVIKIEKTLYLLNEKLAFFYFYPIQYSNNIERIDVFSGKFTSPTIPFIYTSGIKRKEWSYEKEWRLIPYLIDGNNFDVPLTHLLPSGNYKDIKGNVTREIYYPLEAITKITFGKHFFNGKIVEKIVDNYTWELKKESHEELKFINFIIDKFNDRLYMRGEMEKNNKLYPSEEQIELIKIDEWTIQAKRSGNVHYYED